MPRASQIAEDHLKQRWPEAFDAFVQTFAAAVVREAPRAPTRGGRAGGTLVRSVQVHRPTMMSAVISLVFYARYVAEGTPSLSGAPAAVRARARYQAAADHPVTHPNPFPDRAWTSPEVEQAKEQLILDVVRG